jgi:hypothetical protein
MLSAEGVFRSFRIHDALSQRCAAKTQLAFTCVAYFGVSLQLQKRDTLVIWIEIQVQSKKQFCSVSQESNWEIFLVVL